MSASQRPLLNGRPHYVHKTKSARQAHLFHIIDPTYHVPRWVIGPTAGGNDGWAYCESDASTPHEILGTWVSFDGSEWSSCKSLRFEPKEGEGNDCSFAAASAPASSPFGAPPAAGVPFGSLASATASPFAPAPAASPWVVGAGAYDHVNGEYRVDVAAGLKDGVPCYIKVGDPSVASSNLQVTSTITRREGKWWMASSVSNQPPSMVYSVASADDKLPPTGWGRDGCVPLPTGFFAPSADKMALMPSIVPLVPVAGA
eukprot:jgi/Chrpa1/26827/Chrysochromulina_OHIO_Genome00025721-RA